MEQGCKTPSPGNFFWFKKYCSCSLSVFLKFVNDHKDVITHDISSPRKQAENIATNTGAMEISTVASPTGIFWNAYVPESENVLRHNAITYINIKAFGSRRNLHCTHYNPSIWKMITLKNSTIFHIPKNCTQTIKISELTASKGNQAECWS